MSSFKKHYAKRYGWRISFGQLAAYMKPLVTWVRNGAPRDKSITANVHQTVIK